MLVVRSFRRSTTRTSLPSSRHLRGIKRSRARGSTPACFGVAGPVLGQTASLTNVPWRIDAAAVAAAFDIPRVALLNDLQAMAYAVPLLEDVEVHVLQAGQADPHGNIALIAAGTGPRAPRSCTASRASAWCRRRPKAATPTTRRGRSARSRCSALVTRRHGRAEVEKVVSGRGLVNIHRVTHAVPCTAVEVDDQSDDDPAVPAAIAAAALERRCRGCMEALDMFVDAYGAETGNWALRTVATGGVFVGGGIAPKILPALVVGRFMRAFLDKAPFEGLLSTHARQGHPERRCRPARRRRLRAAKLELIE